LNLARRGSNKNEINGKLLKAPKIVISKEWQSVWFYITIN
jgi:hypothetical protein